MIPLPPEVRERLDEIAEGMVEEWRVFTVDAISQAEVAASVADVVSRVIDAAVLKNDVDQANEPPPAPLARRVLEILRRQVIDAEPALPSSELLLLLRAIERVAEHGEPQWSDRFQDRMAGPSGLDLIVEVAHDLRSPLTSILFLAETMFRGRSGPLTPLQERQLGLVYSAAFGLNAVASDVIELVRGGDRLVRDELQPFAVADVLEAVRDIVLPIAEEKGLSLTCEGPVRDRRLGHPSALNRVLLNLTTNALKFTADGGVVVRIADVDEHTVECSVQDTGRGIPDAAMSMLFEPFRRRQQPGDYAFSGSGLGLSICRKLVEAMGSELTVKTVQGEGTCFAFRLPLQHADSEQRLG